MKQNQALLESPRISKQENIYTKGTGQKFPHKPRSSASYTGIVNTGKPPDSINEYKFKASSMMISCMHPRKSDYKITIKFTKLSRQV